MTPNFIDIIFILLGFLGTNMDSPKTLSSNSSSSFLPDDRCGFGPNWHCPNNQHTLSTYYLQSSFETTSSWKESIEKLFGPKSERIKEKKVAARGLRYFFYDGDDDDGEEVESEFVAFDPNDDEHENESVCDKSEPGKKKPKGVDGVGPSAIDGVDQKNLNSPKKSTDNDEDTKSSSS